MKKRGLLILCAAAALAATVLFLGREKEPEQPGRDLFEALGQPEGQDAGEEKDPIVILLSHSATEDRPTHKAALCFKETLEELSDGAFYVDIYPNDTLGNVQDNAQAFSSGSVQMRIGLGNVSPLQRLVTLTPAISDMTMEELDRQLQTGTLRELLEKEQEKNGIVLLEIFAPEYRYLACNSEIDFMEDFKRLNIRVAATRDIVTTYWSALGAETTLVDIKQLHMALQQGAVNAHENTLSVIMGQELYQYQKYIIQIPHCCYLDLLIMNQEFYRQLTPDQQEMVRQAASQARDCFQRESESYLARSTQLLESYGIHRLELSPQLQAQMRERSAEYELPALRQAMGEELYQQAMELLGAVPEES